MKGEPSLTNFLRNTSGLVPCPIFMPGKNEFRVPSRHAFTLIELLVVIAIIGVLAAMVSSVISRASRKARIAVAVAERTEMATAIQEYHDKLGFYPPDNPDDTAMNPLWFELSGTTNDGTRYVTLDGSGQILLSDLNAKFDRQGLANSGTKAHSTDEAAAPVSFLSALQAKQLRAPDPGRPQIKILSCSVEWPAGSSTAPFPGTSVNPWHYNSSHPTNNPGSYDLWVDLLIGGKIYQVNNWSKP
jgi:prepilin-type N-terminal cleavage/methylation domain-containing protein